MSADPMRVLWDALKAKGCEPHGVLSRSYHAFCPVHGGDAMALTVSPHPDGRAIIECKALHCPVDQIVAKVGLTVDDLRDETAPDPAGAPEGPAASKRKATRASDIHKQRLRWLWRGRLALGYLAVWCGAGDIGKSMFSAYVISELTHGTLDGQFRGQSQNALIICTEDGREDMWVPRLEAAGADLERVEFLDYPAGWDLRDGGGFIADVLTGPGADIRLVYVDALMSHMPEAKGGENTRSPTYVRAALAPLADACREHNVTGLFGLHPRKAGGDTFADVVQESGAFTQLPRIGLLFGYHPDDLELPRHEQRRVIIRGKGNVGRDPGGLSFRISEKLLDWDDGQPVNPLEDGVGYITDVEACHVTERQLLHASPAPDEQPLSKVDMAAALIAMALRDGEWHPAAPIRTELAKVGLDHNANVVAARKKVGARASKETGVFDGQWGWQIVCSSNSTPDPDSSAPRAMSLADLTLRAENTPNPNGYGKSQKSQEFGTNGGGGHEESKPADTSRERAHASDPPAFRRICTCGVAVAGQCPECGGWPE